MRGPHESQGFNGKAVTLLTGLGHRKLVYLDATGLIQPSVRPATGSGSRRIYSFSDLIELRAVADMREAGLSLQRVRLVVNYLRHRHNKTLASTNLIIEGKRVYMRTEAPRTLEEITAAGQFAMVLPLGKLVRHLSEKVYEISAPRVFSVRVGGKAYRARATPDLEAGGYSISFPGLPGCFSEADTMGEARRMAREAVEAYVGASARREAHSRRALR